jgi:hypothetical protein
MPGRPGDAKPALRRLPPQRRRECCEAAVINLGEANRERVGEGRVLAQLPPDANQPP